MTVSAEAPPTPFKGLAAFQDTELDALLFYGREREREVVVANLLASRLTVLYGASGVGKTSLLRAAVVQRFREAGVFGRQLHAKAVPGSYCAWQFRSDLCD